MTEALEKLRQQLVDLCRKHRVKRLDVFGSALHGVSTSNRAMSICSSSSKTCCQRIAPMRTSAF